LWSKLPPEEQRDALRDYQSERGMTKIVRALVSKHERTYAPHRDNRRLPGLIDLGNLGRRLSGLALSKHSGVEVFVVDVPGSVICLTKELSLALQSREE